MVPTREAALAGAASSFPRSRHRLLSCGAFRLKRKISGRAPEIGGLRPRGSKSHIGFENLSAFVLPAISGERGSRDATPEGWVFVFYGDVSGHTDSTGFFPSPSFSGKLIRGLRRGGSFGKVVLGVFVCVDARTVHPIIRRVHALALFRRLPLACAVPASNRRLAKRLRFVETICPQASLPQGLRSF